MPFSVVFNTSSLCASCHLFVLNIVYLFQICWACVLLNFSGTAFSLMLLLLKWLTKYPLGTKLGLLRHCCWSKRTEMPLPVTRQTPEDLSAFGLVSCILCMQITGICSKYYFGKHRWLENVLKYIFSFCKAATMQLLNYIISAKLEFALFHVLPANRNEIQIYRLRGHGINNCSAGVSSQGVESLRLCPNMNANICLI